MPLSIQVYKWVTANSMPGVTWHPIQGGVRILLVASCYWNQDKLRPDGVTRFVYNIPPTCSTYSVETSCGPPRQGQHVTIATPLSTAALIASTRSLLEGMLPLPYVTKTTPSIGDSKHPFIFSKKTSHDHRRLKTMFTSEFFGHKNFLSLSAQRIEKTLVSNDSNEATEQYFQMMKP